MAAAFLVALVSALHTPASAAQVQISASVNAPVFPYGEPQIFQVLGNTNGQKCNFSFYVTLNGAKTFLQGGGLPQPVTENVPLPWTSMDLRLPSSNGANYTLTVQAANSASNACTGTASPTFAVEPQIGTLQKITVSSPVVATNMTVGLRVVGQMFGSCTYSSALNRGSTVVAHATLTTLPYDYTASFPDAGDYVSTADEIDQNGQPEGCTGHVKAAFTVIARPVCPSANQYYQSSDDSEFGCFVPGVWFSPAAYQCPTGYTAFEQAGQTTQWGCKQPSKPGLSQSAVNSLLGSALNPGIVVGLGGPPKPTPAPQTSTPTIVKIQSVSAPPGAAYRPNSNIFYAGEHYSVSVVGNIPNNGGYDPQLCAYRVVVQNIASDAVATSALFTQFNTWDVGVVQAPGNYRVVADPYQTPGNGGSTAPCAGAASINSITFLPQAAWITSMKLVAGAYHFRMSDDMAMPQFCQNCDSIFSPAHDREFLGIAPTIQGSTPGQYPCAYNITMKGSRSGTTEAIYRNGQGNPNDLHFPTGLNPPWWNEFNDNSDTVTVTISPGNDELYPPCHVVGGSITKTISFTNNTNAPWVSK
jgi:hypothetical protein